MGDVQPDYLISVGMETRRWPFRDRFVARVRLDLDGLISEMPVATFAGQSREGVEAEARLWCQGDRYERKSRVRGAESFRYDPENISKYVVPPPKPADIDSLNPPQHPV